MYFLKSKNPYIIGDSIYGESDVELTKEELDKCEEPVYGKEENKTIFEKLIEYLENSKSDYEVDGNVIKITKNNTELPNELNCDDTIDVRMIIKYA